MVGFPPLRPSTRLPERLNALILIEKNFSFADIQSRNETKWFLGIKSPERLCFYVAILSVDICFIGHGNAGDFIPHDDIESQNKAGIEQRKIAAKYLVDHAKKEFNIPGITFGARYDGSPILPQNDVGKITDSANEYKQSPIPGGRAPHFWLSETESIYDKFGFNWTLIRFRPISDSADTIIEESKNRGLDLKILNIENQEIKKFYDANLIVIRPDQIVAWRGNTSEGFDWDLLLGNLI